MMKNRFYPNMKAKHAIAIAIAIALTLAGILALTRFWNAPLTTPHTQPPQKPPALTVPVKTQRKKPASLRGRKKAEKGSPRFQDTEFYRTIVDNNLFRPLGWTQEPPVDPYLLIGTLIPTDENAAPQAILQNTATGTTHTLTEGATLDTATTLLDIQPKQVTLEKEGERITLTLNTDTWLK